MKQEFFSSFLFNKMSEQQATEGNYKLKIAELQNKVDYYKRKCSIWISRYKWVVRHFVKTEVEDLNMYNTCYGWSYPLHVDDSCNEIENEYEESQSDPEEYESDPENPEQIGKIIPSSPPKSKPMLD